MNTYQGCCTTRAAIRYWLIVFIVVFAVLIVLSMYWRPLSLAAFTIAAGIACVANWSRNRTYHCGISGPILLVAGAVLLLAAAGGIETGSWFVYSVGAIATVGVAASFLLEWRYAGRSTTDKRSPERKHDC